VADHARDAEQSDDITILALEYGIAPEMTATITVPATISELHTVNDFIHSALDQRFCPLRVQNQIDIAVEELFVNVASYAYSDATEGEPGTARVSYSYSATPPSITIKLADDGIPFDPLAVPDEKIPAGADPMELRIGGLGILMAQKSVDELFYNRVDDSNVVTLVKRW
jgi:anti-sigma regulatory factor (Ser/Thr protein kinase)